MVCPSHGTPRATSSCTAGIQQMSSLAALIVLPRPLRRLRGRTPRTLTGHPALDIPLLTTGDSQRTGRHILSDHRTGGGIGTIPDCDRSHEHIVRARLA